MIGAVEVIDRARNRFRAKRFGAKYLDTRSGRIRLTAIRDNKKETIEAFVRANVKPGATLITDGDASYADLADDCRFDPRVIRKMAAHLALPWIHRVFSLMKRWGLGTPAFGGAGSITTSGASMSTPTSTSSSSGIIDNACGTSLLRPFWALRLIAHPRTTGRSRERRIPARAARLSGGVRTGDGL